MATNQTENYQLNQWEPEDQVLRTEFNADNQKIDAALKAEETAREALADVVAGHTAAITKLGNCRIENSSYIGTGTYGEDNPTKITFSKKPLLFLIIGNASLTVGSQLAERTFSIAPSHLTSAGLMMVDCRVSWSGNQLRLVGSSPQLQMNENNDPYYVFSLFAQDE